MSVYLRAKFQLSSITLMCFRQRVILLFPTSKRTPKKSTHIRVKNNRFSKAILDLSLIKQVHKYGRLRKQ